MRSSHPDAFRVPILPPSDPLLVLQLLPLFVLGMFPLLFLALVGFFLAVGILGLLILFIAVGDELDAVGTYDRRIVTQDDVRGSERAGYQTDMRSALRPAFIMKIVGLAMVVVGYGGW